MGSNPAAVKESEADLVSRAQQALESLQLGSGGMRRNLDDPFRPRADRRRFRQLDRSERRPGLSTATRLGNVADVCDTYPQLKWSHFYAALTWDDAAECLQWAQDIGATVAEMKAWRRAQRGEDLSTAGEDESFSILLGDPVAVKAPFEGQPGTGNRTETVRTSSGAEELPSLAGVARQSEEGGDYAPFRDGAASPPGEHAAAERVAPTPEQAVKRITSALERCQAMLTADVRKTFPKLPEKVRQRFLRAMKDLQQAAADLT